MASDRRQFERAYSRRQALLCADELSVPDSEGITAVAATNYPLHYKQLGHDGIEYDEDDIAIFELEARDLVQHLGRVGVKTELFTGMTATDMNDILSDKEVSSVVVIGHGSISDIFMNGAKNGRYDWRTVSENATHLKQGTFTQRQVGSLGET